MAEQPHSYDSLTPTASPYRSLAACCPASLLLLLALFLAGCSHKPEAGDPASSQVPVSNVDLRVLVVGDPAIATAVDRLQGEWKAQTGASFQVQQAAETDPVAADLKNVDVVICPSYSVAALAEKQRLVPIPQSVLHDTQENWRALFPLLRTREAVWGSQTIAVPFGSPVLTCYYRADLLEKLGTKPPRTWEEYRKLAAKLSDRSRLGDAVPRTAKLWTGTLEPLAPPWAGIVLLARAAAYATHRANYSNLFSINTMEPLVASPPFVRALTELVEAAKRASPESLKYNPSDVRRSFWRGECGMCLCWPTGAEKCPVPEDAKFRVGFCELPGAVEVYNIGSNAWQDRGKDEDFRVPLMEVAGRVGVVTANCPSPETAAQLLLWLSGDQWNRQVSGASAATTLFRQSDTRSAQAWVEAPAPPAAATQYAESVRQSLSHSQCLSALRIPGRNEYLAALDEAVAEAVRGKRTPEESLERVASRWREITERLTTSQQKSAYRHSMGMD